MKILFKEIILAFKKVNTIPTLPLKIEELHTHIFTRIFRFIGGLCVLLNLTKYYEIFPQFFLFINLIYSVIQMLFIITNLLIKMFYMIYIFIYKKELFEVIN